MSIDMLKDLHLLTRDGQLNADARRKLKLIATGVAEACIAVNNAVHLINPKAKVNPGHSSNLAIFGQSED